jgi:filamentous hemagglutinin family protein
MSGFDSAGAGARFSGAKGFHALLLLGGSMLAASVALANPVLPNGGMVGAGSANIVTGAQQVTVTQNSARAVIDWSNFSIGSGGTVRFDNGSGATLNRVKGGAASQIDGLLSASGSVYLINPNGVVVGKSGVVDVGGNFVASTLGIDNDRFMAGGDLTLSGNSGAAVINLGKIGALGGDVVLSAAAVTNEGVISAGGAAGLLSGSVVLLRDTATDAGKFAVQIGTSGGSVTNGGAIRAAMAELRANGGNVYALAGNTGGLIQATGVGEKDGKLYLIAEGGDLVAEGTLSARAKSGAGGFIETSGDHVDFTRATIDTGSGNWLIDPYDLTIDSAAAAAIGNALEFGDVTIKTTATGASGPGVQNPAGAGDITINAPISWANTRMLALSAYRDINVNAAITDSIAGKVVLRADGSGTGVGTVAFGSGVKVTTPGMLSIYYHQDAYATPTDFSSHLAGGVALTTYYLISNLAQLQAIGVALNGNYFQNANIDASASATMNAGEGFVPIGGSAGSYGSASSFSGNYFGNGFTITGLTINRPSDSYFTGLFAVVDGSVQNVTLVNANISGGYETGGIAGQASGKLTGNLVGGLVSGNNMVGGVVGVSLGINDSNSATAVVSGYTSIGGLVGEAQGNVSNGSATGRVTLSIPPSGSGMNAGGLVGLLDTGATISNSTATGDVIAGTRSGGLVGASSGTITHSLASGNVTGSRSTGGLVGYEYGGSISASGATGSVTGIYDTGGLVGSAFVMAVDHGSAMGSVTGSIENTGGLIGNADAISVANSFATGAVKTVQGTAGGLIGLIQDGGTVSDSYASGSVTSSDFSPGGLIGTSQNVNGTVTVSNVYATGAVTGAYAGGLIGYADGRTTVSSAYATGKITGTEGGGLVGRYFNTTILSSFWDVATTGRSVAAGSGTGVIGATGLTGAARYQQASYSGFNFTAGTGHWVILQGDTRPILSMEYSTTITTGHALQLLALHNKTDNIVQGDIDLSETSNPSGIWASTGFVPIGGVTRFFGSLKAANGSVVISGLYINRTADAVGLFSDLGDESTISGINLIGANVTGTGSAGALVGINEGTIIGSSSSGVVKGAKAGGLVGYNENSISQSFSTANVTAGANGRVGGLVGYQYIGTITDAYAGGTVTATAAGDYAGGLVGWVSGGTIRNVYATGAVNAASGAIGGGLVGRISTAIINSTLSLGYASGAVGGSGTLGGLVGEMDGSSSVSNLYWDIGTTGRSTAIGSFVGGTQSNLVAIGGTSGNDVYTQATYAALNFSSDWGILSGDTRPMLRSELQAKITNLHQLQLLAVAPSSGKSYQLAADITGSALTNPSDVWRASRGFVPIGSLSGASTISLDGRNHSISDLVINRPSANYVGLFGLVRSGTIERIRLVGGTVNGGTDVGGLIGWNTAGMIEGVSSSMVVTGSDFVGGLIGENMGWLLSSSDSAAISAGGHVGGLAGDNLGLIDRSSATGNITSTGNFVGGAVGKNQGIITRTIASGVIKGNYMVGGLAGASMSDGVIAGSSATGAVTGYRWTGGLIGENDGTITRSWAGGAIRSIGQLTGGLIGKNTGTVSDVYATGKVSGGAVTGGLIGWNTGTATVTRGYASGAVTGVSNVGGVVGFNDTGATVTDVYWDLGTTGVAVAAGLDTGTLTRVTAIGTGTPYPADQNDTYPSFDFTKIWRSTNSSFSVRPTLQPLP